MRRLAAIAFVLCVISAGAAEAGRRGRVHVHVSPWSYHHYYPYFHYYPMAWGYQDVGRPDLAIVDTDVSPENARLFLDGRFIGIADDFDGLPDHLYLRPGHYTLEVKLPGFEPEKIEITAEAWRRYEIDFRMNRIPGEAKAGFFDRPDRPVPFLRVFEPEQGRAVTEPSRSRPRVGAGPDLSLRPDLGGRRERAEPAEPAAEEPADLRGGVRLSVAPEQAAVYLDGEFVGTGEQLGRLKNPIRVSPGEHTIAVLAPGLEPVERSFTVEVDEVVELAIEAE